VIDAAIIACLISASVLGFGVGFCPKAIAHANARAMRVGIWKQDAISIPAMIAEISRV
jgi:hypothetical protein